MAVANDVQLNAEDGACDEIKSLIPDIGKFAARSFGLQNKLTKDIDFGIAPFCGAQIFPAKDHVGSP
jgi:hypothetical protein